MQGDRRLYFYDTENGRQVDVFIDSIRMSHVIDLRDRLDHDGPCASPSDLLLSKLQIFEVNRKDLVDLTALLLDHPVAGNGDEAIDAAYIARLTADDWGLYRDAAGQHREAARHAGRARRRSRIWSDRGLTRYGKRSRPNPSL